MPTYEALAAVVMALLLWRLTKASPPLGTGLMVVVAAACLYAIFAWGVYFGGPVILIGSPIGFVRGRLSVARDPQGKSGTS